MGMDGLSMANTGMLREATSRDYAVQTEEHVQKEDKNKQVDKLSTQMKVKEDGRNNSGKESSKKDDKEGEDDDASVYETITENGEVKEEKISISPEDMENHTFYVKISKDGEIFELYDKETERLVEKISAGEINQLMLKLNMASGILVNRSV